MYYHQGITPHHDLYVDLEEQDLPQRKRSGDKEVDRNLRCRTELQNRLRHPQSISVVSAAARTGLSNIQQAELLQQSVASNAAEHTNA